MPKKIDMQKATVTTWYRKSRSRLHITQPNPKGNPKSVVLHFKTPEQLDAFADKVLDLLDMLDDENTNNG